MAVHAVAGEDPAARFNVVITQFSKDTGMVEPLGVVDDHECFRSRCEGCLAVLAAMGDFGHVAGEVEKLSLVRQ